MEIVVDGFCDRRLRFAENPFEHIAIVGSVNRRHAIAQVA